MASTTISHKSLINNALQNQHLYEGEKDMKQVKKQHGGNLYRDDV